MANESESIGENTHPSVLLTVIKHKVVGEKMIFLVFSLFKAKINFLPKMVYDQEFVQTV